MDNIAGILREVQVEYQETQGVMLSLFKRALDYANKTLLKFLVFEGIPIASFVDPKTQNTALHYISSYRDKMDLALALIRSGTNVNAQNKNGETPLHYALRSALKCLNNNTVSLNEAFSTSALLIKNGASRNVCCEKGISPIQEALLSGYLEAAEIFLVYRMKPPNNEQVHRIIRCRRFIQFLFCEGKHFPIASSNYSTLLNFAAMNKDEDSFLLLLDKSDFDLNAFSPNKETLLHIAAGWGTPSMIKALVERGANLEPRNKKNMTPLCYAICSEDPEKVFCLLESGVSVNTFTEELLTPLHYATSLESLEIVEMLVKKGADVNALSYNRSPLLIACGSLYAEKCPGSPLYELNYIFLRKNYFPVVPSGPSSEGCCMRHIYNSKIVEFLLDHGANIEAKTGNGRTPLDVSCQKGNLEIAKILLRRGAKISQRGFTTLHCAITGAHPDIIRLVLENGAKVNYRWTSGGSPLQYMFRISGDFVELLDILLEFGADVNLSLGKKSALHLACLELGREYVIRRLLKYNADVNAVDERGLTPLDYAIHTWYVDNYRHYQEVLVSHISRMKEDNKYLHERNLMILVSDHNVRKIYKKCDKEIRELKNLQICSSVKLSFYDILTKDLDKLGAILKNEDVIKSLRECPHKENLSIYALDLEDRIREGKLKRRLVEIVGSFLTKHVPFEISLEILKYCSIRDLTNFVEVCSVNAFNLDEENLGFIECTAQVNTLAT